MEADTESHIGILRFLSKYLENTCKKVYFWQLRKLYCKQTKNLVIFSKYFLAYICILMLAYICILMGSPSPDFNGSPPKVTIEWAGVTLQQQQFISNILAIYK